MLSHVTHQLVLTDSTIELSCIGPCGMTLMIDEGSEDGAVHSSR